MSAWNEAQSRIAETAFAAAVDDALWSDVTERIIAETGARGSFLGILNHSTGNATHCALMNATAAAYEEYVGGMARFDPQAVKVATVGRASIYTDRDHLDLGDPVAADYMKWQADRLGWHSHVTIASRLDRHHCSGMSFHFGRDEAHRAEEVRAFLAPLCEALSQALQLGFLHNDKLTREYWLGISAGLDRRGALLLGEQGAVLRMNAAAERLVRAGDPISLRDGRLQCRAKREQDALDAIVACAVADDAPRPGAALLGSDTARGWFARTSPIARRRRTMVIDEPAALLTVRALDEPGRSHDALWRELFALTPTEAKVADLLRRGLSAGAVAGRLGMSPGTVRTHTKVIHDKTETRRNAELAHLLTLLTR